MAAERVLSPVEKIVAEVPPQVLVERGIGGMMTIDEAKRKYTLTDWDLRKLPRTKVDGRRGGYPGVKALLNLLCLFSHGAAPAWGWSSTSASCSPHTGELPLL